MADQDKLDLSRFLEDYLNDAREGFQEINHALLSLEQDPGRQDCLDQIFRAVHTLKSSSSLLDFTEISGLSHVCEDLLDRLRKHEVPITQDHVDTLFETADTLRAMVEARSAGEPGPPAEKIGELEQRIADLTTRGARDLRGVVTLDESGLIQAASQSAERLFGYTVDELKGQPFVMLLPEPYTSEISSFFAAERAARTASDLGRPVQGLHKDGSVFPMDLEISALAVDERRAYAVVVRGMSVRKTGPASLPTIEKIQTLRVDVSLLDSLFDLVGELMITKNRIDNMVSATASKELRATLTAMNRMIGELQENVSAARLVPVDEIFDKFPRMVRDISRDQHKQIELIIEGRDIELDKAVLDAISEPLIHLLRNAVDHGIEPAEERRRNNKPETGTIWLTAKRAETQILIQVEDNGRGIDLAHIKQVALRKGLIRAEEASVLNDREIVHLLFLPGFTSTEEVTGLSGRGVGLDVVKTAVSGMGGMVEVVTSRNRGSRFTLKMPLTTTIMQTLMVCVGDHVFALGSESVLETLRIKPHDVRKMGDSHVLVVRDQVIPFIQLRDVLGIQDGRTPDDVTAIVIYRGQSFFALGVDSVLDQIENIVKPLDPIAQQFRGFSGGAILGDGRVALLLDIPALFGTETLQEEATLA